MSLFEKILSNMSKEPIPEELRKLGLDQAVLKRVKDRALEEDARGPVIALIGETGVGKTSTLNALFNAGRPISHVRPCTTEPDENEFIHDGAKGPVRVIDMPGLGQSIKADEEHYTNYQKTLPRCDVTTWIFQAGVRAMAGAQACLRKLVRDRLLDPSRLVVGVNKYDPTQPGKWIAEVQQPSEDQTRSMDDYKKYVREVLGEIGIDIGDRLVAYSAARRYDLHLLFRAMLDACPEERKWVLGERRELASPCDMIDRSVLSELPQGKSMSREDKR